MHPINYLADYKPSNFAITTVKLVFNLDADNTIVTSDLNIVANNKQDLTLDGEDINLISIAINNQPLEKTQYILGKNSLTIPQTVWQKYGNNFNLNIKVAINPNKNYELMGLYTSKGILCTQCESEGFRRITYYLDRPDVLADFTVKLIADKNLYPVLLAGGNKIASGDLENNQHYAEFNDPHKKPCYLFALVAGDLVNKNTQMTTKSGRKVTIFAHSQPNNKHKLDFSLAVLLRSMKWDEEKYACEYDLDNFHIVAIDDFNSGAMENKGLNIFNAEAMLASPETTTHAQYMRIEAIIAHEYFHNWSGNRITCNNWFQLSLKEGLTVFRESQYMADTYSPALRRIDDVVLMRTHQFTEDAGNLAHPVRPESYQEISNFYTATVYEKGAELLNMLQNIIGAETFILGCKNYFAAFDGQAVAVEDFIKTMEQTSKQDLSQFMLWYSQAGTPQINIKLDYSQKNSQLIIKTEQYCRPTAECKNKQPFILPMQLEILDEQGNNQTKSSVILKNKNDEFTLNNIKNLPVVSAFGNFCAPVNWQIKQLINTDLANQIIASHADDLFSRWNSSRNLLTTAIGQNNSFIVVNLFKKWLLEATDNMLDSSVYGYLFALPTISELLLNNADNQDVLDLCKKRSQLKKEIASKNLSQWQQLYDQCYKYIHSQTVSQNPQQVSAQKLQNTALDYLTSNENKTPKLAINQYENAVNITEKLQALTLIVHSNTNNQGHYLQDYYNQYKNDAIVVAQWFRVQASNPHITPTEIEKLFSHPAFSWKNPNLLRATLGAFGANLPAFHNLQNNSYEFFANAVIKIDKDNNKISSRLAVALTNWQGLDKNRKQLMQKAMLAIKNNASKALEEVIVKSMNEN